MLKITIAVVICIFSSSAASDDSANARILSYNSKNDGSGLYHFSFESNDGVKRDETGDRIPSIHDETLQAALVKGSYSYTGADGLEYVVKYVADESGFHPEGDHFKVPPFVPWKKGQPIDDGQYKPDHSGRYHPGNQIFNTNHLEPNKKEPVVTGERILSEYVTTPKPKSESTQSYLPSTKPEPHTGEVINSNYSPPSVTTEYLTAASTPAPHHKVQSVENYLHNQPEPHPDILLHSTPSSKLDLIPNSEPTQTNVPFNKPESLTNDVVNSNYNPPAVTAEDLPSYSTSVPPLIHQSTENSLHNQPEPHPDILLHSTPSSKLDLLPNSEPTQINLPFNKPEPHTDDMVNSNYNPPAVTSAPPHQSIENAFHNQPEPHPDILLHSTPYDTASSKLDLIPNSEHTQPNLPFNKPVPHADDMVNNSYNSPAVTAEYLPPYGTSAPPNSLHNQPEPHPDILLHSIPYDKASSNLKVTPSNEHTQTNSVAAEYLPPHRDQSIENQPESHPDILHSMPSYDTASSNLNVTPNNEPAQAHLLPIKPEPHIDDAVNNNYSPPSETAEYLPPHRDQAIENQPESHPDILNSTPSYDSASSNLNVITNNEPQQDDEVLNGNYAAPPLTGENVSPHGTPDLPAVVNAQYLPPPNESASSQRVQLIINSLNEHHEPHPDILLDSMPFDAASSKANVMEVEKPLELERTPLLVPYPYKELPRGFSLS